MPISFSIENLIAEQVLYIIQTLRFSHFHDQQQEISRSRRLKLVFLVITQFKRVLELEQFKRIKTRYSNYTLKFCQIQMGNHQPGQQNQGGQNIGVEAPKDPLADWVPEDDIERELLSLHKDMTEGFAALQNMLDDLDNKIRALEEIPGMEQQ